MCDGCGCNRPAKITGTAGACLLPIGVALYVSGATSTVTMPRSYSTPMIWQSARPVPVRSHRQTYAYDI